MSLWRPFFDQLEEEHDLRLGRSAAQLSAFGHRVRLKIRRCLGGLLQAGKRHLMTTPIFGPPYSTFFESLLMSVLELHVSPSVSGIERSVVFHWLWVVLRRSHRPTITSRSGVIERLERTLRAPSSPTPRSRYRRDLGARGAMQACAHGTIRSSRFQRTSYKQVGKYGVNRFDININWSCQSELRRS